VSRAVEESNRRLLRARDAMDRRYAEPLDVPTLARIALVSEAHFIRTFRATFGETPNRYLQRRRVERAMARQQVIGGVDRDGCPSVICRHRQLLRGRGDFGGSDRPHQGDATMST